MTSSSASNPSGTITFVVKNNSSIKRTIKVFNQGIPFGGTVDLMDIPGITEEDIRTEVLKGSLKGLLSGGALQVVASTVNFNTFDSLQSGFLTSVGISPTGASGSALTTNPLAQLNWYVDPTNGSDANDGATAGTALKTVGELSRRWGKGNLLSPVGANGASLVNITINILGNVPSTDPLNIDVILDGSVRLVFLGGVASTTPLSVPTVVAKNTATNTPWQITATGGLTVGNRIFVSNKSAYCWSVKDQGSNVFRVSEPCTKPTLGALVGSGNQVSIANTDTFAMETLYTLKLGSIRVGSVRGTNLANTLANSINFRDLDLTGNMNPQIETDMSNNVYESRFSKSIFASTGQFNNYNNCCMPLGNTFRAVGSLTRFQAGAYIGNGSTFAVSNCTLQFAIDVIFQGQSIVILGGVRLLATNCGIFDSVSGGNGNSNPAGNGLMVSGGGSVTIGAGNIWGSGQLGGGIGVSAGSACLYTTAVPTITGSSPGTNDFVLGQATSTYAPAGDGYYVGPTTNSWANFAAPIGAGTGFGGNAVNPKNFASLLKGE